jgi:hypothetical protein
MEAGVISVILILIVLEVILSADNALILGVLVQKLPVHLRRRALFYGILGAYVLRGLALLFAALVIKLWWVQALGAAYLLYIALKHFLKPEEAHAPRPWRPLPPSSGRWWPRWSSWTWPSPWTRSWWPWPFPTSSGSSTPGSSWHPGPQDAGSCKHLCVRVCV